MKIFHIFCRSVLLLAAASLLSFAGCSKQEVPSYVGKWVYLDSTPDLGPLYSESYVRLNKDWDYLFYDGPSGKKVEGSWEDFSNDGLTITLSPAPEYDFPPVKAKLLRLKDNLMVIETESLGDGTLTTIRFSRVSER